MFSKNKFSEKLPDIYYRDDLFNILFTSLFNIEGELFLELNLKLLLKVYWFSSF